VREPGSRALEIVRELRIVTAAPRATPVHRLGVLALAGTKHFNY